MTTNGNGGQVPTRIVELLISNINELTKQVQQMPSQVSDEITHDLEKLAVAVTSVLNKINTPPRSEELDKKLDDTIGKVDSGHGSIQENIQSLTVLIKDSLIDKIKWMTRSVWLVFGLFTLAVLVSTIFINFNTISDKDTVKTEPDHIAIEEKIEEYKEDTEEKFDQILKQIQDLYDEKEVEENTDPKSS